ncbi:MAG: class I SAM-dependent DNA methyltransferase, partial [Luteibacter jiangsuensis]
MNAVEIEESLSLLASAPFDRAEFPYAFLTAFGAKDATLKRLRRGDTNASDVPGGLLWHKNIHLAICEPGSVAETLDTLRASPKTAQAKAKFILATDGEWFEAEDLVSGEHLPCPFEKFADHFGFFLPLAGISTVKELKDNPVDVRATGRLNKLYVELLASNSEWATAERRHDMNHFMARLIFCYFAEDTDIFQGDSLFTRTIDQMTQSDGSNVHNVLEAIFQAMNVPREDRVVAKVPSWANRFPYVNGGLFSGSTEVPVFTRAARSFLIRAGELDWKEINPDIFGSMIQAVADDEERGALGMHYTSVPNILKVLNPLFLDDLRSQLDAAGDNKTKLLNLRKRMSHIRVFDPACGSGNFLVIAYKQMREIEALINERRGERELRSQIPLTNFRGIELRDFPAQIARLALVIAEFQCDVLYRGQQEALADVLPLDSGNWIVSGNALRMDWFSVCPPIGRDVTIQVASEESDALIDQAEVGFANEGGETYICGNPPYLGAKKKSREQSSDMEIVGLGDAQLLDYVCAFIIKGLEVVAAANCAMALVSTSSICQGEQVSLLWPKIFNQADIMFAHRPFKWSNNASGNAGVYCTIIGLARDSRGPKLLFDGDSVRQCESISPYLVPGPKVVCIPRDVPLSTLLPMKMGSNSVDGKKLILEDFDARSLLSSFPEAQRFLRRYGGTKEMVAGNSRWCLWIEDSAVDDAKAIPPIKAAIEACYDYRIGAGRDAKKAARRPHAFCYSTYQEERFIQVGNTIGNAFDFVPLDLKPKGFVSNHNAFVVYGNALLEAAVISSTLHRVWAEAIAGRLGNGIRYGNTIVYNTFPMPPLTANERDALEASARNILLIREAHFPASIGDLYSSEGMPNDLKAAHDFNDELLERAYVGRR